MDAIGYVRHFVRKYSRATARCFVTVALGSFVFDGWAADIIANPGDYAISNALIKAREMRRVQGVKDVTISLSAGTYNLYEPIIVRPEDSNTRFVAEGNVVISGGMKITHWKKMGSLYVADVPDFNGRPLDFRQMWVNGRKAVRARDVADFEDMFRIRNVDKQHETLIVPAEAVRKIVNAPYAEMVLHEMWCIANLRIKSVKIQGDSAIVSFHQPESHIHFMHPWPSPMVTKDGHNSAFYLTNAMELLDKPGEWYNDIRSGKLYYMPRKGENMQNAEVVVPAVETLLRVEGTPDRMVSDVTFKGITFSYATWMRPSLCGHAPLQAGMYMTEAYKLRPKQSRNNGDHMLDNQGWVGRPASAVAIEGADNVSFDACTFNHLASSGLDYGDFTHGGEVSYCTFTDIGGSGIVAGTFCSEAFETHLPYTVSDMRQICSGLTIENNTINDVTNEDWGCVGIAAGYVKDIKILHNTIYNVSYTGISLGWGWNQQPCVMSNNLVKANLIYNYAMHMYDVAGVYTLGSQPHSSVEENVVRDICHPGYAHDPHHWFYLYTDEGSSCITVKNNWTPEEKYLKNCNGPCAVWENNGPQVADSIRIAAGVVKK
jgi:hypothetical protein